MTARTRTSAPGSDRQRGFTIVELIVVVTLIALASSLVVLALRDPDATRLEEEAARLAALLEGARAEARASGLEARWEPRSGEEGVPGFRFLGLPGSVNMPTQWLDDSISAEVVGPARAIALGPEPLIGAQRIVLRRNERELVLATDGLGPFAVVVPTASP